GDGLPQQLGQPLAGRPPVLPLRTMLGRRDRERGARQLRSQAGEDPGALLLVAGRRGAPVRAQLDPGLGGAHALPAGAGGGRELLDQLRGGNPQPTGRSRSRGHQQIVHPASVAGGAPRRADRPGHPDQGVTGGGWPSGADGGTMGPWLIRRRPSPPPRSPTPRSPTGSRTARPSPPASPPATSRPGSIASTASAPPQRRRTTTPTPPSRTPRWAA